VAAEAQRLPNSESSEDDVDVDDDDDECAFEETVVKSDGGGSSDNVGSGKKSPTQSVRSVLSRPRSAPQRRATISGSSPTHYKPYINITEVRSDKHVVCVC
jgi:hypothetical protein